MSETNNNPAARFPEHYMGYLALAAWGALTLFLLRHAPYGLDGGSAKSILLTWSIADRVASSAVTFGTPDLRTILFLPAGILFTGKVFAVKVLSVLLLILIFRLLYIWKRLTADAETALITCGMLIISPILLSQIDALAPGIYLLSAFTLGAWIDKEYRANPKSFGGWYFAQLFICAFSVSLHPAGLAYPIALLWLWRSEPLDLKQQKYFLVGISASVLLTLIICMGWNDTQWLQNPIHGLGQVLFPDALTHSKSAALTLSGLFVLATLLFVVVKRFSAIYSDFTGRTLLLSLVLGLFVGDQSWALLALCTILFYGIPMLLPNTKSTSFFKHRGAALFLIFIGSTFFMLADRSHYEARLHGLLSPQDQLIKVFAGKAESARKAEESDDSSGAIHERIRVASEWPSRTMIACKCDTLPLPPAAKDPATQLKMMKGITHLILDPKRTENLALAKNLSLLGNIVETSTLQTGGVILHIRHDAEVQAPHQAAHGMSATPKK